MHALNNCIVRWRMFVVSGRQYQFHNVEMKSMKEDISMACLSEVLTCFAVAQGKTLALNFYYACSRALSMYIQGGGVPGR